MKFAKVLLVSFFLVGIAAACATRAMSSAPVTEGSSTHQITIDNFSFTPAELTIAPGAIVVWVNNDDVPHTVVGTRQEFRSKALDTGDMFSYKFDNPGTYEYFCSVHPMMTGKIIVK